MQTGQPLHIKDMLPEGFTGDDAIILAASLAIFMIVWSLGQMVTVRDPFGPRLKAIQERRAELKGKLTAAKRRKKTGTANTMTLIRQTVQQLKLLQQYKVEQLQQKLVHAGFRSRDATVIFAFSKLVMPFVGLVVGVMISGVDWDHPFQASEAMHWFFLIGLAYGGARLPDIFVANARARRYHAIIKGLPDALDLMMICAESGLSLAASLDRVAGELGRMNPILAEELSLTSVELGFLPDRAQALKHLGERVDIREVRGLVNVILQTEKYGTPIAQALRTLAKSYRTERMLRAEQKAARLPALMTVPMIVFILPTLFAILLTPAIIRVMDTMNH